MQAEGIAIPLPPCAALYLVGHLMEIGPISAAGMGASAISWQEIIAWQSVTGIRLLPWEALALRRASAAYATQATKASKAECPMPYMTEEQLASNRQAISEKVDNMFKAALRGV